MFTKEQILELYLNQIFLGRNAYGVEAAAQAYFGKSVNQLDLAEMAYLAILPKAPSTYSPVSQNARAVARRDYVLQPDGGQWLYHRRRARRRLGATAGRHPQSRHRRSRALGDYFVEDVRRALIAKFGETEKDGRNSVYGGGLWIRTSIDPLHPERGRKGHARRLDAL